MDIWIVCEHCNQRQVATEDWLICVFCSETLSEHPYFGRGDGETDHEAEKEVENEVFRAP